MKSILSSCVNIYICAKSPNPRNHFREEWTIFLNYPGGIILSRCENWDYGVQNECWYILGKDAFTIDIPGSNIVKALNCYYVLYHSSHIEIYFLLYFLSILTEFEAKLESDLCCLIGIEKISRLLRRHTYDIWIDLANGHK